MSKNNLQKRAPKQEPIRQTEDQSSIIEKWIPATVIVAIITAITYIIVALINRSTAITTTLKPIEFTQTAEAFHTSVAMTVTVDEIQTQTQAANISLTAFSGIQTASAVEAEKASSAVFASQTAEASMAAQVIMTQTAIAQAIPTPTEVKSIRYEHIVVKGDTLDTISKNFLGTGIYAEAIGRANCNRALVEGGTLVVRYYQVRNGDTVDLIVDKFGGTDTFLRFINALSGDVTNLPSGQILILAGQC